MKIVKLALLATTVAATPIAANAQDVGTTIIGNDGNPVGTITSNDGTNTVLDTGNYTITLPPAQYAQNAEGQYTINITKADLEAALASQAAEAEAAAEAQAAADAEAAAKLEAALVVGAAINSVDNKPLGVIEQFVDNNVVINVTDAGLVTLGRDFMALDAEGQLIARADYDTLFAAAQQGG